MSTIIFIALFNMGGQIVYGLTFMTVKPEYLCRSSEASPNWQACSSEQICDNNLVFQKQWIVDYESSDSYYNWVDPAKLDLTCVDDYVIGFIGSAYFFGWMIFSTFLPSLADIYGRKWLLFIGCLI